MHNPTNRRMIGIAALAAAVGGGIVYWNGSSANGGVLLRTGVILGAVWFAWPALARVDRRWLVPALVAMVVLVTRPALLFWVLPVLVVLGLLFRRPSSTRRRE